MVNQQEEEFQKIIDSAKSKFSLKKSKNDVRTSELKIPFECYSDIAFTIDSLLTLCEKVAYVEGELAKCDGNLMASIYNVLTLTKSLIPHEEFEVLDQIKTTVNI